MKVVQWTAYGCFGLAGLGVIMAMANEAAVLLGMAVSLAIVGVGFLAAHQALGLLADIRDAVASRNAGAASEEHAADMATPATPARSAAEIAADIQAMKARS